MLKPVQVQRRDQYGYIPTNYNKREMKVKEFINSDKKIIQFWAENIRGNSSLSSLTFNTFRGWVKTYLKQENLTLKECQLKRVMTTDIQIQRYADIYYQWELASPLGIVNHSIFLKPL